MLGVNSVHGKDLIDVGERILMSEPVAIERRLKTKRYYFFASFHHRGMLVTYSYDRKYSIQSMNILDNRQVEVEDISSFAFL